jgi:site-specific recombinase XerD
MTNRTRVVFLFYIKRTKLLRTGEAPIYLQIKVDKTTAELAIMKSINPDLWSVEKNGATGTTKEANDINSYLSHIKQQVNNHLAAMRDDGAEITAKGIKNSFLGINPDEKRIAEVFEEHNKNVKILVGKDFAPATLQRYESCLLHLRRFITEKYKVDDIPLRKLNREFITGFEMYLKTNRNCSHNTTMRYIKNFKKIVRICFGNGWMKHDPFTSIKLALRKIDKGFLSEEEIRIISNKQFSCDRLQQVADVFLFGCYTGYAYSDLKKLSPANIVKAEDGQIWIHAKRLKTDMDCHVPLLPFAKKIIEKYSNHPYCKKNNVLLPVTTNQKLNAYLKEIADICSINKEITTHMARHTFATTITLNNDIPIESVSKMLGHSSIKMTQVYAKLLDKKVGKDMQKLQDKLEPKKPKINFDINLN